VLTASLQPGGCQTFQLAYGHLVVRPPGQKRVRGARRVRGTLVGAALRNILGSFSDLFRANSSNDVLQAMSEDLMYWCTLYSVLMQGVAIWCCAALWMGMIHSSTRHTTILHIHEHKVAAAIGCSNTATVAAYSHHFGNADYRPSN
jgi:hypothetical protein